MIHQVVIDGTRYNLRGFTEVMDYHLEPPLPADAFSYVLEAYSWEEKQVVTGEPNVLESIVVLPVPLATTVFSETGRATTEISVAARARVLRYGGSLFLYGGLIGQNPPRELPLEVLEWKIAFGWGEIRYESHKDAYRRVTQLSIGAPPSARDVCVAEGLTWPQEPYLSTSLERFFFQRWLKDRSLALEDAELMYEAEVLAPHRQAMGQYQGELAECESYYSKWLEQKGVLLTQIDEIWKYLRDEALPQAAQSVKEHAQQVLQEAGCRFPADRVI